MYDPALPLPRVAFDLRPIRPSQAGVRIYALHLLEAIAEAKPRRAEWHLHMTEALWATLPEPVRMTLLARSEICVTRHLRGGIFAVLFRPLPADPRRIATLFPDYYAGPVLGGRRAVVLHDLAFRVHRTMFSRSQRAFRWAMMAAHRAFPPRVLTISQSTFLEVEKFYPTLLPQTQVVGSGADRGNDPSQPIPQLQDTPFVLTVGTLNRHKNYPALIRAYGNTNLHAQGIALAICGKPGNATDAVRHAIAELGPLGAGVRLLHGLEDAQIVWAYRNTLGTILPSLYEGFGLPAAEALSCGSPLCCSNIAALREAGGSAALYFDATDPLAMTAALEALAARQVPLPTEAQRAATGFGPVLARIEAQLLA